MMGGYLLWWNFKLCHTGMKPGNAVRLELQKKWVSSSTRPSPPVNHYKVLGVTTKSTQAEIKASFYKLSKIFHPDVSENSEDAADKFRQITAAYEILGNSKLKKMYDKGLLPSGGSTYSGKNVDVEYEEPEVKSPYRRTGSQPATGRTNVYDYDQWSRLHYGTTLNRRSAAKEKWVSQEADQRKEREHQEADNAVGFVVLAMMLFAGLHFVISDNYDAPTSNEKNKKP